MISRDVTNSPTKKQLPISKQKMPPPRLQLQLEIEAYNRIIKKLEKEKKNAGDEAIISITWNEVATRKILYDTLVGETYSHPPEVSRLQKSALVKFFIALHGHAWSRKNGWVGQPKILKKPEILLFEAESSVFEGVEVTDVAVGHKSSYVVTSLHLDGVGCTGKIPNEFCELIQLQNLYLHDNLIGGTLPRKLNQLVNLKRLCLNHNCMQGNIEESIFNEFSSMLILDLSCNNFTGRIPNISAMTQLSTLNLANNNFQGELPECFSVLSRLRSLKMHGNALEGYIPYWFCELVQLKELNLSHNRLCGGLENLMSAERLETLVLNHNNLADNIATCISSGIEMPWNQLNRLRILYMHNNHLTGNFPPQLAQIHTMRLLNISNNDVEGILPDNIGNMISLRTLILSGNRIVGPVPRSMENLRMLRDFDLFKSYPAELTMTHRGFKRRAFERVFEFGPAANMNSVHWDPFVVYGPNARVHTPVSILSIDKQSLSDNNSCFDSSSIVSHAVSHSSTVTTAIRDIHGHHA